LDYEMQGVIVVKLYNQFPDPLQYMVFLETMKPPASILSKLNDLRSLQEKEVITYGFTQRNHIIGESYDHKS